MGGMSSSKRTPKEDWVVGENEEKDGVFVDLSKNIEAFTGYQGQKIWNMIYQENCFKGGQCLEERLLYKVLSGMHASVSSHLSEYYFDFKSEPKKSKPNVGMYFKKVGNHEERIKNLYFAYTIMLRSFKIISKELSSFDLSTKNLIEDTKTMKLIQNASRIVNSYSDVIFDESAIFKDKMKENLKYQLKEYFYNISRLMNCVECEKCKVYGKLQIKGLGTALKILFDDQFNTINKIKRNEMIAFINTLTKWSTSLIIAEKMFERRARHKNEYFVFGGGVFLIMVVFSYILVVSQNSSMEKLSHKLRDVGKLKND